MSHNLFSQIASRTNDRNKVFIRTAQGRAISYGDAYDLSARYANVLTERGVSIGDRVAVQVEKSPEAIILYLACLRAGAAFLPLNTAYTIAELEYFLGDASPHIVVCTPEKSDAITPVAENANVAAS